MPDDRRVFQVIFNLLHQKDVKDYIGLLNPEERLDLFYHLTGQIGRFKSGITKSGDEFTTNASIAAKRAGDINFTSYQKVTTTLAFKVVGQGNKWRRQDQSVSFDLSNCKA